MVNFLKKFLPYYFLEISRPLWSFVKKTKSKVTGALALVAFWGSEHLQNYAIFLLESIKPFGVYILVFVLLFLHIKIIYNQWKENNNKPILASGYDIPDDYNNIIEKVEKFLPEKLEEFKKEFISGYKNIKDTKKVISRFFSAYKIIQDFLFEYFQDRKPEKQITEEMIKIKNQLDDDFLKLKNYNDNIGIEKNLIIRDYEFQQLIDDINTNINSLFPYIK